MVNVEDVEEGAELQREGVGVLPSELQQLVKVGSVLLELKSHPRFSHTGRESSALIFAVRNQCSVCLIEKTTKTRGCARALPPGRARTASVRAVPGRARSAAATPSS